MKIQYHRDRPAVTMLVLLSMVVVLVCVVNRPKGKAARVTVAKARTVIPGPNSITHGVYHEDLAGVGHLGGCIVPAQLKPRFAGMEGKYLEVESSHLEDEEWAIGPIVMREIYAIRRLPPLPVEIDVNVKRTSADEKNVDVVFSFRNVGTTPAKIDSNYVQISLLEYRVGPSNPTLDGLSDSSAETGYTARQLHGVRPVSKSSDGIGAVHFQHYTDGLRRELRGADGHRAAHRRDASMGSQIQLRPKESLPYFWRTSIARPGRYELAVHYSHYVPETQSYLPILAWKTFDVPLQEEQSIPKPLTIHATVTTELTTFYPLGDWETWHTITGRIINETGRPRHVFASSWDTRDVEESRAKALTEIGFCLPGEFVLYGNNGELLDGTVDWSIPDGPVTQHTIGPEGIPFQFQVWRKETTRVPPIERIEFWMITDEGLERITVAKAVHVADFPEPAWSPTVQGLRCRIRPVRERYSMGEAIRIGFEVESDGKAGDALYAHFDLTYDGQTVRWLDSEGWHFPFRTRLALPDTVKVTPGRHKLRVTVQGNSGKNSEAKSRNPRTFDETLVSNELEIVVVEASGH